MITSAKKNPENAQASNRILIGTEIIGDITSNGDMRIDGKIKGSIKLQGKLVIGEQGEVEGDITCSNATIAGNLKGKANVAELLSLQNTAKVEGDMYIGRLQVEPGAVFTGSCTMGGVVRLVKEDAKANASAKSA
jgi:cytoskeletal protein CcmA (bactofilin family)